MWKPFEIQSFGDVDTSLAEQVDLYLAQKETDLGRKIIDLIAVPEGISEKPELYAPKEDFLKLSEAIEIAAKKIRHLQEFPDSLLSLDTWQTQIRGINQAFWEYIEILEGGVTELFRQVRQVGLERWTPPFFQGVEAIKEVLIHRIEDISWVLRRLENNMREYRTLCQKKNKDKYFWKNWSIFWQPVLDPSLLVNLKKSEKYLKAQYNTFADHYHSYKKMWDSVLDYSQKFRSFQVLIKQEEEEQDLFLAIIRYLRLWQDNAKQKSIPQEEVVSALKRRVRPMQAYQLFFSYYHGLKETIFGKSRELKRLRKSDKTRKEFQDQLILYRKEVRTLLNSVAKYREFLLRTDPDPYVRSRWGFTEWIVGPEPFLTQKFISLVYEVKDLKEILDSFIKSLSEEFPPFTEFAKSEKAETIDYTLHEMAQPLNTEEIMQRRAETLMEALAECKEIGASDEKMVDFVGEVLSRAMRADGKYHVLQRNSLFLKIYHTHMAIVGDLKDEPYRFRREKVKETLHSIQESFKKVERHIEPENLEELRNDLRAELQDFLGSIQKQMNEKPDKKTKSKMKHQLLEYRFIFSQFFHFLHQKTVEGQPAKNLFLFVDSYLESVERLLGRH